MNCAIIFIQFSPSKCNIINQNRFRKVVEHIHPSSITGSANVISEKQERATFTITDDNNNDDNVSNSHKEFPSSEIYQDDDDYDISPALGDDELDECILSKSEFYLSWWVHENGSLKISQGNRFNGVGFVDLSLEIHTEESIYSYVLSMQTQNASEVGQVTFTFENKKIIDDL